MRHNPKRPAVQLNISRGSWTVRFLQILLETGGKKISEYRVRFVRQRRGRRRVSRRSKRHAVFLTTLCRIRYISPPPHLRDRGFFCREAIKIWIKSHSRRARKHTRGSATSGEPNKRLRAASKFIRVTGVLLRRHILLRSPVYLRHGCALESGSQSPTAPLDSPFCAQISERGTLSAACLSLDSEFRQRKMNFNPPPLKYDEDSYLR